MAPERKNWDAMDAATLRQWASAYRGQAIGTGDPRLAATLADLASALDFAANLVERSRPAN